MPYIEVQEYEYRLELVVRESRRIVYWPPSRPPRRLEPRRSSCSAVEEYLALKRKDDAMRQ